MLCTYSHGLLIACMYAYACMYIYIHTCMHVSHTHTCMYVCVTLHNSKATQSPTTQGKSSQVQSRTFLDYNSVL